MGIAEDKFLQYLRQHFTRLSVIRVDEMLSQLAGCFTDATIERLKRQMLNEGNQNTLWDFFNDLKKRDDWVNHLIRALENCDHRDLATEFRTVYESFKPQHHTGKSLPPPKSLPSTAAYQPSRLYNQQRSSSLPPQPSTVASDPQPSALYDQQQSSSLPPQPSVVASDPQPGPSMVSPQVNRAQLQQETLSTQPSQQCSEPQIAPKIPTHPPAQATIFPSNSALDQPDAKILIPVPETTPVQPAPSEIHGETTKVNQAQIQPDSFSTQPPQQYGEPQIEPKTATQPPAQITVFPNSSVLDQPDAKTTTPISETAPVQPAPLENHGETTKVALSTEHVSSANPPSVRTDGGAVQPGREQSVNQEAVKAPALPPPTTNTDSVKKEDGADKHPRERLLYQQTTESRMRDQSSLSASNSNDAGSTPQYRERSADQPVANPSEQHPSTADSHSVRTDDNTLQPGRQQFPYQGPSQSSCRPVDDDEETFLSKPGVLHSRVCVQDSTREEDMESELSRIPVFEISDELEISRESDQAQPSRPSEQPPVGQYQSRAARREEPSTSTPSSKSTGDSSRRVAEENDFLFLGENHAGRYSEKYNRSGNRLPSQQPEENSFDMTHRFNYAEEPSALLMDRNDNTPSNTPLKMSDTRKSNETDEQTVGKTLNEKPVIIASIAVGLICLSLVLWKRLKN